MIWSLTSAERRNKLAEDAERSRSSPRLLALAWGGVIAYNIVGLADIVSTIVAIELGAGEEANPFVRMLMDHAGDGWIFAKLFLQMVISAMVLWFPHWIVLSFFLTAVAGNAAVVYSNLLIAGQL